mgnify:CR=1 FL=1
MSSAIQSGFNGGISVPIGNWIDYTIEITGTSSNPSKGTIVRDKARYRRVGDSIEIHWDYQQSAAGSIGSGTYLFSLPPGLVIDTDKFSVGADSEQYNVGSGYVRSATFNGSAVPQAYNSTNLALVVSTGGYVGSTLNALNNATWYATFNARVPIAGWNATSGAAINAVDDWKAYTPVTAGLGTITSDNMFYRRIGDSVEIMGAFTTGTTSATELQIGLPTGLISDSTKVPNIRICGQIDRDSVSSTLGNVAIESAKSYMVVTYATATGGYAAKQNGNFFTTGNRLSIIAKVPVSGWSSNITMAESSTYNISSFLANGTRVTGSAPTRLGEYRSYLRNAGARTYTETNGSPATAPSASNGILIYGGNGFASADTNNEPSRYEIFVGKNKNIKPVFYSDSGRTGYLSPDAMGNYGGSHDVGVLQSYDPTTGIINLTQARITGNTSAAVGLDQNSQSVHNGYFDIVVSENALAVGMQMPRSELVLRTGNGYGSTNTVIRRWTTTEKNIGSAFTYADSSTLGGTVTINEPGIYGIQYGDRRSSGSMTMGISRNSTQLTTGIASITAADRIAYAEPTSDYTGVAYVETILEAGDVIRAHSDGNSNTSSALQNFFRIIKVSN